MNANGASTAPLWAWRSLPIAVGIVYRGLENGATRFSSDSSGPSLGSSCFTVAVTLAGCPEILYPAACSLSMLLADKRQLRG